MVSAILLFAIFGAATGALYALNSLGLVLTYRGSGVINFASGAIGMVGTFVFWYLADEQHWPAVIAVILGLLTSAALGYITHLLMVPLRNASNLTRIVLTLAVLVVVTGAVGIKYSSEDTFTVNSLLPVTPIRIFGASIGQDRLWLVVLCIAVSTGVYLVYRYTRFGVATTAGAENEEVLGTLGWSTRSIAGLNWALGGALSGLAGIMLAPITGLSTALATELLLPSLAAAVLGNFTSFPLTVAGSFAIGIIQDELQRWVNVQGVGDAVPFARSLR